jgi:hypothetical protein
MIDHTSTRIQEQQSVLRRRNRRRYAFQRMLEATDRLLWRLEEMNRDDKKSVGPALRADLRRLAATMPASVREPLRDGGQVQETLDSLFEVQERLLRWRYPGWHDFDPDSEGFDAAS